MSETLILVLGLIIAIGVVAIIALLLRPRVADPAAEQRLQELNARLDAMGSWLQNSHSQLQQTVNTRLDSVSQNIGESMKTSTKNTTDHLKQLHERLAVIDSAQKNITDLASTVTSLQKVFDNKQRRGAFGQGRMEAIIADALPQGAYEFQFTLSNNSRPDCCIHMPDNRPSDHRRQIPAGGHHRAGKRQDRRRAPRGHASVGRISASISTTFPGNI